MKEIFAVIVDADGRIDNHTILSKECMKNLKLGLTGNIIKFHHDKNKTKIVDEIKITGISYKKKES
jgi:hypothetical protein